MVAHQLWALSLHPWPVGLHIQRSPRSDKARIWPRLVPHWAACLGKDLRAVALGYPWVFSDEAGEGCTGCVREGIMPTATHSSYILSRSHTRAHALPDNCNRKALPITSHSISPSFPLPRLGTTAWEQWEHAHVDILSGQLMLCPTMVTGKTSATPQTFCITGGVPEGQAGSEHRWGSYPIPVQTPSRWLLVFSFGLLAAPSLCV